jgi:hypothetical protein
MAFPDSVALLDDFNRANGAIGANYTAMNGAVNFIITSNAAAVNAGAYSGSYWNPATFGPDVQVHAELPQHNLTNGFAYTALWLRMSNPTAGTRTAYYLSTNTENSGEMRINRQNSDGSTTVLDVTSGIGADWSTRSTNRLGFEAEGTVLRGYHYNGTTWTLIVDYDTTADSPKYTAAGSVGFDMFDSGSIHTLNDLYAGTISGAVWPPVDNPAAPPLRVARSNLRIA